MIGHEGETASQTGFFLNDKLLFQYYGGWLKSVRENRSLLYPVLKVCRVSSSRAFQSTSVRALVSFPPHLECSYITELAGFVTFLLCVKASEEQIVVYSVHILLELIRFRHRV